jgi:integrase
VEVGCLPPHQQGRHTYATWLRTYAGVDLIGLKEAGGWESLSSVERYAHLVPNESSKAADRLPDVHLVCTPLDPDKKLK